MERVWRGVALSALAVLALEVGLDGSAILPIGGPEPAGAVVPGANGRIAFTSDRDGDSEVFVMDADGSNQTQLTFNTWEDITPSWSPDGQSIAWAANPSGPANFDLFVAAADGTGAHSVTAAYKLADRWPTWSPDGTRLAFMRKVTPSGNFDIYTASATDGSGAVRVAGVGAVSVEDCCPDWSADGTRIVFGSKATGEFDIYTVPADGSAAPVNVTANAGYDGTPAWSPAGTSIAFRRISDIWVVAADGTGAHKVTTGSALKRTPEWSPDGASLVYSSNAGANDDIYVIATDGSGQRRLTTSAGADLDPSWQPVPDC